MMTTQQKLNTAVIMFLEDNYVKAIRLFSEAYAEKPQLFDPTHMLYWSKSHLHQNETQEAVQIMSKTIAQAPDRVDLLYQLIKTFMYHNSQHELANKLVEALLKQIEPLPLDDHYIETVQRVVTFGVPIKRRYRYQTMLDALASTQSVAGAVVECGCLYGLSVLLIGQQLRKENPSFQGENLWVLDSFEGLSEPQEEDFAFRNKSEQAKAIHMVKKGAFQAPFDQVKQNLSDFPAIQFVKGWIPDSLAELPEQTYRFINLDVDLYEPYRGALEYFFPRLNTGGIISCDDYSPNWPGARKAIDEFCAKTPNAEIRYTDYHQAVITKQ
jgi:O-methyltransferase